MEGSKIWEIAVLKTDSMLPQEKFVSPDGILFSAEIFCEYLSCYYLTLVSSAFFDLSNRRFSKKQIFTDCSVLTDFCHFISMPLKPILFQFFWGKSFFKSCYSSICYLGCFPLHVKLNQSWSIILSILMLLMRIVFEFCMKQVFKCRERRVMQ